MVHRQPILVPPLSALYRDAQRPLLLDLGSGRGAYLADLAAHGARNVLGVELRRSVVDAPAHEATSAASALLYANVLHAAHRSAILTRVAQAARFDAVLCLFPDPFFKAGHRSRRVFGAPLLDALVEFVPARFAFDIVFKSDVLELFLEARQLVADRPRHFRLLEPPAEKVALDDILGATLTTREQQVKRHNIQIFQFVATRRPA